MSLTDIILTIIIQVLFCGGLRVLLSDGQILHFIRSPFEYETDSKLMNIFRERLRKRILVSTNNAYKLKKHYEKLSNQVGYCLKPFILCVICFSSVWGATVILLLNGFQLKELIICCISTAFILKIISDKVDF